MTMGEAAVGRELPLRGLVNARDLGGLRTDDGRQVRHRRVLRSDRLTALEPADVTYLLDDYGLHTVIDLRGSTEIETDGKGALPDAVSLYRNTHVYGASRARLDLTEVSPDGSMFDRYREYLEHSPQSIAAALDLLADDGHLPALIHCAAGKDRTGVVIALLLAIVGVRDEDIIADYAATTANIPAIRARSRRAPTAHSTDTDRLPTWVYSADADTMRRFLAHLATERGGALAWATDAGLGRSAQQQLAANLLEPVPAQS
ncbi:tyrosine-protein phosphatase [Nocardia sp. NPDC055029]|uniref:tyrosine-protein phosphatase n=1 Tax=Nocardia sp. NPDC060259 TaxID=3347088 RepID=UPI0036631DA2